jgi:hypothetical protein
MHLRALLRTPEVLPRGTGPTVPGRRLGGFQGQYDPSWDDTKLLPYLAIKRLVFVSAEISSGTAITPSVNYIFHAAAIFV